MYSASAASRVRGDLWAFIGTIATSKGAMAAGQMIPFHHSFVQLLKQLHELPQYHNNP